MEGNDALVKKVIAKARGALPCPEPAVDNDKHTINAFVGIRKISFEVNFVTS